jgi:negative regulator of flagellin synthesis FlgM
MSTPIDPTNSTKVAAAPRVAPSKPVRTSAESDTSSTPSVEQVASEDTVHLTGDAVQIHQLAASVSKAPVFDTKRVADLKQAISNGKYPVDSRATAGKLLKLDSSLGSY